MRPFGHLCTRTGFALLVAGVAIACSSHPITDESGLQKHKVFEFPGDVTLLVDVSPFREDQHRVRWCTLDGWKHVCTIDDRPYFGTIGTSLPQTQLDAAQFRYGSHEVNLEVSSMFDPWIGEPSPNAFSVEPENEGYTVKATLSDGDSTYEAEWWVVEEGSIRTTLRSSEENSAPCPDNEKGSGS